MAGKIYPEESMILRVFVGEAKQGDKAYEMLITMTQEPIVQSKQTGKYFHLSWKEILAMAESAGIDDSA